MCLTIGDFVYLLKEPIGPGKKFKPKYSGPFVVYKLLLNHMVTVRDPHTGKVFKPVHKDRLKVAYVRELDPIDQFVPKLRTRTQTDSEQELSESDNAQHKTDTAEQSDAIVPPNTEHRGVTDPQNDITLRRSTRKCNEPVRFCHYSESMSETSDTSKFYKIRRILG